MYDGHPLVTVCSLVAFGLVVLLAAALMMRRRQCCLFVAVWPLHGSLNHPSVFGYEISLHVIAAFPCTIRRYAQRVFA